MHVAWAWILVWYQWHVELILHSFVINQSNEMCAFCIHTRCSVESGNEAVLWQRTENCYRKDLNPKHRIQIKFIEPWVFLMFVHCTYLKICYPYLIVKEFPLKRLVKHPPPLHETYALKMDWSFVEKVMDIFLVLIKIYHRKYSASNMEHWMHWTFLMRVYFALEVRTNIICNANKVQSVWIHQECNNNL